MSSRSVPQLSLNEFTILGLVSESKEPVSGSDLEAIIKVREMREWTSIGKSSIYHSLKKLEKKRLIRRSKEIILKEENNPPKKKILYFITDIGRQTLEKEALKTLCEPKKLIDPFVISLSNSLMLSKDELSEALKKRILNIGHRISWLSDTLKYFRQDSAKGFSITGEETTDPETLNMIRAIFERPLMFAKCEKEWLAAFLKEIEKKYWYMK
ncbi:MAG: PadR family transcriptional regulator [Candidatus Hodarchaeales archaeon]|jgi:DNA-binding PadR family transcriptional regulator